MSADNVPGCSCGVAWRGHPNPHSITCPMHDRDADNVPEKVPETLGGDAGSATYKPGEAYNVPSQVISSAMSRVAQHDASDLNAIANAVQDVLGFTVWSKRYAIAVLALEALRGPEPTEKT